MSRPAGLHIVVFCYPTTVRQDLRFQYILVPQHSLQRGPYLHVLGLSKVDIQINFDF
jgi:hypothetical protein